jgi:hypothetical protein
MRMKVTRKSILNILLVVAALLPGASSAFANASVTTLASATIFADTAGAGYTALTGPVLDEGSNQDIGLGTIILQAPAGFAFDPTVLTLNSGTAVVTPSTITITVTKIDASGGSPRARITWSGIRVRPTAGTPVASGNLTFTGTSSIHGIASSTSFGTLTEVAGVVSSLVFAAQPGSATAGSAFGMQPVIRTQDQFGNNSTNGLGATANVALSLTGGAGPLQGTATLNLGTSGGQGVATYSGLRIDVAGTDKQLTATGPAGLPPVASAVFTVNPSAASKLVMHTQPAGTAVAGVPFAQQPVVLIQDAFNN